VYSVADGISIVDGISVIFFKASISSSLAPSMHFSHQILVSLMDRVVA
jgi:hypothetical protein